MKDKRTTNAWLKSVMFMNYGTTMRHVLFENKDKLNKDGYLSFEEVGSLRLSRKKEKEYGYRYIDGVQLLDNGNFLIWVSDEGSRTIESKGEAGVPLFCWEDLFNKVYNVLFEHRINW